MTGRIESTFERLRQAKKKALIAYLMAGDPSLADTERLVLEIEQAGADIIELGVPFSDPIADGPVIQLAAERGLSGEEATRLYLSERQPSGRFVQPEDVAALVAFLCGPAARDITGAVIPIDGGWSIA